MALSIPPRVRGKSSLDSDLRAQRESSDRLLDQTRVAAAQQKWEGNEAFGRSIGNDAAKRSRKRQLAERIARATSKSN